MSTAKAQRLNPESRTPSSSAAFEVLSGAVEETQALGERLGALLKPGDVVALHGELGSGKTTLIQGIARGLGRDPSSIRSPTFVIMREYPGATPLVHIDGYRLEGAPAVSWLDLDLIFAPSKITLIEWAQRFSGLLPEDHLAVALSHVSANRRRLRVSSAGPRAAQIVSQLQAPHSKVSVEDSVTPNSELQTPNSYHADPRD